MTTIPTNNQINNEEINLSDIDWNKMSITEYHALESKLQEKIKTIKAQRGREPKKVGTTIVLIRGKHYQIKTTIYMKLIHMKSEKAKEKMLDDIISKHNPIQEIL